jgi:hypothetical protein
MRRRSIILAMLAVARLHAAPVQAQPVDDVIERCRELQQYLAEFVTVYYPNYEGLEFARGMSAAIGWEAARNAVGPATMRMFAFKYDFPPELDALVTADHQEEFWHRAELILEGRLKKLDEGPAPFRSRLGELESQLRDVDCKYELKIWAAANAAPPSSPPPTDRQPPVPATRTLPVGYYPAGHPFAGNPIMTDDLISRWLKGSYAAAKSGGGYWLAASMTVQDFEAVKERINAFLYYAAPPSSEEDLKAHFSAEELLALRARERDLRNAWAGNWSAVERM